MRWKRALMLMVRLLILSVKERNGIGSSLSSTTPLTMVPIKHILLSDDIIHQARGIQPLEAWSIAENILYAWTHMHVCVSFLLNTVDADKMFYICRVWRNVFPGIWVKGMWWNVAVSHCGRRFMTGKTEAKTEVIEMALRHRKKETRWKVLELLVQFCPLLVSH